MHDEPNRSKAQDLILSCSRPIGWPHPRDIFDKIWFENCIVNVRLALEVGRYIGIPIAHLVPMTDLAVDSESWKYELFCRQVFSEELFDVKYPSIFANERIGEYIHALQPEAVLLVGFSAHDVLLAAAIESEDRGRRLTLMRDCSPIPALSGTSIVEADRSIFSHLRRYADVDNFGDYVVELIPELHRASEKRKQSNQLLPKDTLSFLLLHLAKQATAHGLDKCAKRVERAARELTTSDDTDESSNGATAGPCRANGHVR